MRKKNILIFFFPKQNYTIKYYQPGSRNTISFLLISQDYILITEVETKSMKLSLESFTLFLSFFLIENVTSS